MTKPNPDDYFGDSKGEAKPKGKRSLNPDDYFGPIEPPKPKAEKPSLIKRGLAAVGSVLTNPSYAAAADGQRLADAKPDGQRLVSTKPDAKPDEPSAPTDWRGVDEVDAGGGTTPVFQSGQNPTAARGSVLDRPAVAAPPDRMPEEGMLTPEFVRGIRGEFGKIPPEKRFDALRELASGNGVKAMAARIILRDAEAENMRADFARQERPGMVDGLERAMAAPRVPIKAVPGNPPEATVNFPETGALAQWVQQRDAAGVASRHGAARAVADDQRSIDALTQRGQAAASDPDAKAFASENPMTSAVASGAANMLRGLDNIVPTVLDFASNLVGAKTSGAKNQSETSAWLERKAQNLMPEAGQQEMGAAWHKGEFGEWLMLNLAANAPQLAPTLVAAFVPGTQGAALGLLGGIAAGNKYADTGNSAAAVASGMVEGFSERLPLKYFKRSAKALSTLPPAIRGKTVQAIGKALPIVGKHLTAQGIVGTIEEVVAQIGNNAIDATILEKDNTLLDGVAEAAVIGAFASGGLSLPQGAGAIRRAAQSPEQHIAQAIDQAAAQYGLNTKAAATLREKTAGMEPEKAASYAEKVFAAAERAGLVKKPGGGSAVRQNAKDLAAKAAKDAEAQQGDASGDSVPAGAAASSDTGLADDMDAGAILGTQAEAPQATSGEAPTEGATDGPMTDEPAQPGVEAGAAPPIEGEPINKAWSAFTPESGTLNIPREQMPQVDAEHRGALVQFLGARGITHESAEVPADSLKPTQAEFSPKKVEHFAGNPSGRSILVSQDGYVLDGHHQWMAKRAAGEPVKVIRLNAPIQDLLRLAHQFPSSTTSKGPRNAVSGNGAGPDGGRSAQPGPADAGDGRGTGALVPGELQQPGAAGAAGGAVPDAGPRGVPGADRPGDGNEALTPAAPRSIMKPGFDSDAWQKERDDRIKASREAGNTHLDTVPAYVETMRGKQIGYVHDPKVKGRILTVDNNGNVYVEWLDAYSQEKEGATPMKMGNKTVMQTSLGPRDLKDYTLAADKLAPTLTAGQPVTIDGKPYTVKSAKPKVLVLTGADGKPRTITSDSATWAKVKPAEPNSVSDKPNSGTGPRILGKIGRTPNAAETVELRPNKDGTLTPHQGKYAMVDYETGEPVVIPGDSTNEQAIDAIKKSGAMGAKDKWFGVQKEQPDVVQGNAPESQAKPDQEGTPAGGVEPAGAAAAPAVPAAGSAPVEADGVKGEGPPMFESYADAQQWVAQQTKKAGGALKFRASDEYKAAYEQIKALYDAEKKESDQDRLAAMKAAGLAVGDKVQTFVRSMFLGGDTRTGTIAMRSGAPIVKLDGEMAVSSGGSLRYVKSMPWDARWKKAADAAAQPAASEAAAPPEADPQPTSGEAAPASAPEAKAQPVAKQAQPQVTRFVTKSDMVGSTVEWQEQQASGDWMRLTTFDTMQQAKDAAASRGYDAEAIPRFVSEFSASAKRFLQAVPEAAPAERTPKAQAVKEALARKAGRTLQEKVERPAAADEVVATAGQADAEGERKFYVTMVRGDRVARLAGPFDTKAEADAMLPRAQDEANKADPRSAFDAFGVSGITSTNHKPGTLNDRLGITKLPEQQTEAEFGAVLQARAITEAEQELKQAKAGEYSTLRFKSKAAAVRAAEANLKDAKESRPEQFAGDHLAAINKAIAAGRMPSAENIRRYDIPTEQLQFAASRAAPAPATEAAAQPEAEAPAAAPAELPRLPVEAYRIERRYANGAVIRPLPGKSFTNAEVRQIADWFRAAKWEVSTAAPSGVSAVNNANMSADDIPEPYTAAQRKKDERRRDADAATAAKTAAQDDYLTGTAAGEYVAATFGDTLNKFNSVALAKFLAGEASTFEGLMNARAADVVQGMGIAVEGRATKDVLADLKARFAGQSAPAPQPPSAEASPAAKYRVAAMVVGGKRDGQIIAKPEARIHAQLGLKADDYPGMQEFDLGFVDAAGKFYTRTALGMDASQYNAAVARGESPEPDEAQATYSPAALRAKQKREAPPAPERTPKAQAVKEALAPDLTTRKGMVKALKKLGYEATDLDAARTRIPNWGRVGVKLNTIPFKLDMVVELKNERWQFNALESEDPQSISQQEEIAKFKADFAKLIEPAKRAAQTFTPPPAAVPEPAPAPAAQPAPVATHKDPGEPAEPVTPAVVREAIKTGVQDTGRKPSAMRAELLREIDRAIEEAPDYQDFQAVVKTMGLKDATAVFTDAKGTLGDKAAPQGYSRPTLRFKIEGDGVFTVNNTVRQLLTFRAKVEASPGFRDRQAPAGLNERATDTLDRRSADAAIGNMIDEGDFQAAMDYAQAKGVDMANVKLTKMLRDRLDKWERDTKMAAAVAEFESRKPEEAAPLELAKDGIAGREVSWGTVPNGNDAFQYAIGKTEEDGREAIYRRRADERGSYGGWRWEADAPKGAQKPEPAPAPAAEPEADDIPEAGIASQTFEQWSKAQYSGNEYKAKYLEKFGGDEKRAILASVVGTIDTDRTTAELLKAAKQEYRRELFNLPRESVIALEVWDELDNMLKVEAQRHFYDLDARITRRDQDTYSAKAKAEAAKKAPYEAAFAEVDAEIRRLDKIPGPETQKQKDLSARRSRLREAIYQIGQGKEPDGRLLRKEAAEPAFGVPVKRGMTVAQFDAWAKDNATRQPEQFAKRTEGVGLFAVTGENKGFKQVAGVVGSRTVADDTRDMRVVYRLDDGRLVWWRQEDGNAYEVSANDPRLTVTMEAPKADRQQSERTVLAGTDDEASILFAGPIEQMDDAEFEDELRMAAVTPQQAEAFRQLRKPTPAAQAPAGRDEQPPAEQAAAILNAAAEPPKGAERLSVIKDVKAGAITPEEVAAAFPPAGEVAAVEPVAATGTESLNKRHAIPKKQALTPAGSLKADATNSRADSAVWYYQGDMDALRFTASVKVNGEADPRADDAKRMLVLIKAAQDAGWRRANYRAGSLGTVWVFQRGDEFLTRAGMENAAAVEVQRPAMPEDGPGWDKMVARQRVLARAFNDWLLTLPEDQQYNRGVVSRKIGETPVGQWAGIGDDPKLGLTLRYFPGPGEKEAREVGWTIQTQSRPDWPALRDYIAELAAEAPVDGATAAPATAPAAPAAPASAMDAFKAVMQAVYDGKATVEDYQAGYARVRDEAAMKAELGKMTKDDLTRMFGIMRDGKKDELVAMAYSSMLRNFAMGKEYGPSGGYMMTRNGLADYEAKKRAALDELVAGQTADDLAAFAAEQRRMSEERAGKRAAMAEAIKAPKTLEDFQNFIRYHQQDGKTFTQARMMLTPEQRAAYDELVATETRSKRKVSADEQRTTVRAAGQTTAGEIIATKHTRDGHDLYVVRLVERVSTEDYQTLLAGAKRIGGSYSSFRGNGAVPGFQFRTRDAAEAFQKLAQGDNAAAIEAAKDRRDAFQDDRSQTVSERLIEMADRLEDRADESLGRERKANTARRASFAASAEAAAQSDKAMAKTMRNIASAITGGTAKFLDRVRQKTQVEMLQGYVRTAKDAEIRAKHQSYVDQERHKGERPTGETADYAEFPSFTAYRSDLASLGRQLLDVDGTKLFGQRLMKVADDVSDAYLAFAKEPGNLFRLSTFSVRSGEDVRTAIFPSREVAERAIKRSGLTAKAIAFQEKRGVHRIIMSPSLAMEQGIWKGDGDKRITLDADFGAELVEKMGRANRRGAKVSVPWQFESAYDRRKALARMGIETPAEFRSALREFIGLREAPAAPDKVKELERAMVGRRSDGMDFFPTPESTADEMVAAADIQPGMRVLEPSAGMGHIAERIRAAGFEPDVVEMSGDRRELLEAKGFNVIGSDFIEIDPPVREAGPAVPRDSLVSAQSAARGEALSQMGDALQFYDRGDIEGAADMVERAQRVTEDRAFLDASQGLGDRLRFSIGGYDRIIMNPPFSDGRDIQHVRHAYDLLKPGGRLVAIMGESAFTNQNKRATEFREWLDQIGGTEEKLDEGTFNDPSLPVNTSANARMVVIEKPVDATPLLSQAPVQPLTKLAASTTGTDPAALKTMVANIRAGWADAPPVTVVGTTWDLPANYIASLRRMNAIGKVRALIDPVSGHIYVIADRHESLADAQFSIFHEVLGHYGLRKVLGPDYEKTMRQMRAMNAGLAAESRSWMAEYGPGQIEERVKRGMSYAEATVEVDLLSVEEALSDRAGKPEQISGFKRLVAKLQAWLREHGLMGAAQWLEGKTQAQVLSLLQSARDAVEKAEGVHAYTEPAAALLSQADQTDTPAFKRWFGKSAVVDAEGKPLRVYHGTKAEFTEFKRTKSGEFGPAIYLTDNPREAGEYGDGKGWGGLSGTAVMPLYVSIQNPYTKGVDAFWKEFGGADSDAAALDRAQAAGYDGIIAKRADRYYDNAAREFVDRGETLTHFIAFRPEQIKSALGNSGAFDPSNPSILLSQHTPEQREALARAGIAPKRRMKDNIRSAWEAAAGLIADRTDLAQGARQAMLDQFYGIQRAVQRDVGNLPLEQDPYVTARLANGGTSSVMRAMLLHGQAQWAANGQHLEKKPGTVGLLDILKPLGDDLNDWFGWMIGNRAARLFKEGRENNFTEDQIKALQALGTPEKIAEFRKAALQYAAFKRSVLDVAEAAGLINKETRPAWDNADYIPFYRQIDEKATFSATGKKGLAGQSSGIRTLKGGESALHDPIENLLMNFSRLIDASLKNNALSRTVRVLEDAKSTALSKTGYTMSAEIVPRSQIEKALADAGTPAHILASMPPEAFEGMAKMWAIQPPTDPSVIRIMRGGKPQFYKIHDPLLLKAATSFVPFDFPGLGVMRAFKRVLTAMVTSTPEFMLRNFIRDSAAVQGIARTGVNPAKSLSGIVRAFKEDGAAEHMLFAGASFQSGNTNAADPTGTATSIRRALRQKGMDAAAIDGFMATIVDKPARVWELYKHVGEAIENANREAIFEATAKKGSVTAAAYEAKDLMDFSLRGSHPLYQLAADVLPFFNARVQGLYRVGRANPARLAVYAGIMAALSVALIMANSGEDWYDELPDWDKDAYWHFMIGGTHFRIPKPFELGVAFATIPERIARYLDGQDSGSKTVGRLFANVRDQLAFDPIPQAIRPAMNVWANKDTFRGAPIENIADEGKMPRQRYSATTSETARLVTDTLAPATDAIGLSPKKLEYLIGGYLGTVGTYALGAADMVVRELQDAPEQPAPRLDDLPIVKAFVREAPARSTVYENDLYTVREHIEQVYRSASALAKEGKMKEAKAMLKEYAPEMKARGTVLGAAATLAGIRREREKVYADRAMTPEAKRERLDELQVMENKAVKKAMTDPKVKALQ